MFTIAKDWISSKLLYIKIGLGVLIIASIAFLYVQNIMYRKDIEKSKIELSQKELIIKSQSATISTQEKTIALANAMTAVRDEELKKFADRVDVKIKPMNDLITQIKNGDYGKAECAPSKSVKAVIGSIQSGETK
jgi:hypothetical protein